MAKAQVGGLLFIIHPKLLSYSLIISIIQKQPEICKLRKYFEIKEVMIGWVCG
jgi:hypothetical protein